MFDLNLISNLKRKIHSLRKKTISSFVLLALLILPFQNCGKFEVSNQPSGADQSSLSNNLNDGGPLPGPNMTPSPLPTPTPGGSTNAAETARIDRCKSYLQKPVITNLAALNSTVLNLQSGLGTRSGDTNSATLNVDADAAKGVSNMAGATADNCNPTTQLVVAAELNNASYPASFTGGVDEDGNHLTPGNQGSQADDVLVRVFTAATSNAYNTNSVPFRINIEDNTRKIRCASGSLFFRVTVRTTMNNAGTNPPAANSDPAFVRTQFSNSCWTQSKLVASTEYPLNANAGHRVAIDGNWAAVLAQKDNNMGAVYMFSKSGSTWSFAKKVVMNDAQANHTLSNIALKNGVLAVSNSTFAAKGKVYIYKNSGTDWVYSDSFVAPESALDQKFGIGLALGSNFLAVGASDIVNGSYTGKVYIYDYNGSTFTYSQSLSPSSEAYKFGQTLAVSGNNLAVGAPGSGANSFSGAVFVFTDNGSSWTATSVQKPTALSSSASFGTSVALDGSRLAVGAERQDSGTNADTGAVYYYANFSGALTHTINGNAAGGLMGAAVAFSSDSLFVGATVGTPEDGAANSGYISRLLLSSLTNGGSSAANTANGGFVQFSEDKSSNEYFGQSIATDGGNTVIVGAPAKNVPFQRSGAAYIYSVR